MGNVIDKGKKSKGFETSIVNPSNKYPVPAFNNAKNLATLQDYPRNNLPQILEAYQYWLQSDGQKTNNLTILGFEDVFGQLFADPVTHFHQFHNPFISVCPALEVFNLFILMCSGHMKNKFRLLCEINHESKQYIRVDVIQALLYRMLVSLQLAFTIEIPPKDELNAFIEYSIKQFIERNTVVNQELISHLSNDHHLDDNVITTTTTTHNTTKQNEKHVQLSFKEFWQWCQDVSMISNYIEAIQKICSIIANKMEDSRKGSQFLLRNSFFAPSITRRSSNRFDMGSILNKWQRNNLTQYSFVDRHVTWTNTFRSLAQTSWLEDILILESDQHISTLLEHILLSPRKSVVVIDRQIVKSGLGGGDLSQSQLTSSSQQPRPPGASASSNASFLASSRNIRETGNGINVKVEESDPISTTFPSAFPRSSRAGKQNIRANYGEKVELLGILDHVSIVTWILQCLPATVFSELIEIEESVRSRRLSLEFALEKTESKEKKISSLLDSIMKEASEEKERTEKVSSTEEYDAEDMLSIDGRLVSPRAPVGSSSRRPTTLRIPQEDTLTSDKPFVARVADNRPSLFHNATIIPWQKIGEKIFHTSAKNVFSNNVFLLYNHKQNKRSVFSVDYPIYNAFLLFAQGHRQIPLANDLQRNYFNVHHTLDVFEMASFLYDNFSTYFPDIDAKRSIYWSGLMRKPNLINCRDTLAVGWMKLLQSRTDSAMIVDEQNKVCGVLTLQDSLKEIWWRWRKRFLVEENISFSDLEQQYLDGNYAFYDPSLTDVKTSSSTFASGMANANEIPPFSTGLQTFGNNTTTNARLMGGLNLTINTSLMISEESTPGGGSGRPMSQRNFNLQMTKDLTLFSQLQTSLDRCEHILGLKLLPLEEHIKEVVKPRKTINTGPRSTRRTIGSTNPASAANSTPAQEGFFPSDLGNLFNSAITSMATPKTGKSAHKSLGFNELASPAT